MSRNPICDTTPGGVNQEHEFVAVMGTLGSGKTTAARLLARELNFKLNEEVVEENAFLPRFYKDMKRWAFDSQVFFLMQKIRQMVETKSQLKDTPVVQDTPIVEDVFSYAKAQHELGNMDDAEWSLYQKIYNEFVEYVPKPDLIVYLETSIPEIEKRIEERGRGFEQAIPTAYLQVLDKLNHEWLQKNKDIPVVVFHSDRLDIARDKDAQKQFVSLVRGSLYPGQRLSPRKPF